MAHEIVGHGVAGGGDLGPRDIWTENHARISVEKPWIKKILFKIFPKEHNFDSPRDEAERLLGRWQTLRDEMVETEKGDPQLSHAISLITLVGVAGAALDEELEYGRKIGQTELNKPDHSLVKEAEYWKKVSEICDIASSMDRISPGLFN